MSLSRLANLKLGEAEDLYRQGSLTQVEYEAYRRAWAEATRPYHEGYYAAQGWLTPSSDPAVESLAHEILEIVRTRREGREVDGHLSSQQGR